MHNSDFYLGILSELHKTAQPGDDAPTPAPAPAATPAATPNIAPAAHPAGPGLWQGIKNRAGTLLGAGIGTADNLNKYNPIHRLVDPTHDYLVGKADQYTANHAAPGGNGFMQHLGQSTLRHDPRLDDDIDNTSRTGSLGQVSHGFYNIDRTSGTPKFDFGNGLKTLSGQAEGWMGQHPWLTGAGGGLALTGLLASLMRRNHSEQSQPININVTGQNENTKPTSPQFIQ